MRLLLATRNAGKLRELRARVQGMDVLSLDDVPPMPEVEETEDTLEGNARLKALAAARATALWTVADDSGLFVDALGGAPGVRSARYAPGSDADRVQALLRAMEGVPDPERGAAFRCVLALASPQGEVRFARGECQGKHPPWPAGAEGFGYDPVFLVPELGETMAELSLEEKGRVRPACRDRLAAWRGTRSAAGLAPRRSSVGSTRAIEVVARSPDRRCEAAGRGGDTMTTRRVCAVVLLLAGAAARAQASSRTSSRTSSAGGPQEWAARSPRSPTTGSGGYYNPEASPFTRSSSFSFPLNAYGSWAGP